MHRGVVYCHLWYKYPETQTSEILLVFVDFFIKTSSSRFFIKPLYTGQEAELLRERKSRAKIKNHLSHRISATCLFYRRGRYVNKSFPTCAISISQQHSRTALLFFFTTTLLSCRLLCKKWIQVLRAMLWYVCSGRGVWTSVAGLGAWHIIQHHGNPTGLHEPQGKCTTVVDYSC